MRLMSGSGPFAPIFKGVWQSWQPAIDVFVLRGVDIYRVLDCQPMVPKVAPSCQRPAVDQLQKLSEYTGHLVACRNLDAVINVALEQLSRVYEYHHSFVMVRDEEGTRLYTLASRGFPVSGVGSEVGIGEGLIGMAAERRLPVRCTNLGRERPLSRAVREELVCSGDQGILEREILLPGLPNAQSHLVIPLVAHDDLLGVLCLQSEAPGRFLSSDECAMQLLGRHLAASMAMLGYGSAAPDSAKTVRVASPPIEGSESATVKYYRSDDSIFIDDTYLIKGIPGRIFHKLIQIYLDEGREGFTNREIRLDLSLKLPDIKDNLEARLILLRRRLDERCDFMKLVRTSRGRLHLLVGRRIRLEAHP